MITISFKGFSQTWDNKNYEQRKMEILRKICLSNEVINQNDFTDLYEKGLLDTLINNIRSSAKDVEQIDMIINNSNSFFNTKCKLYSAKADSIYHTNLLMLNILSDSTVVVPVIKKKKLKKIK